MLISSNAMISVLDNIMWSTGKNVTHKAKGKSRTSTWALVGQDDSTTKQLSIKYIWVLKFLGKDCKEICLP